MHGKMVRYNFECVVGAGMGRQVGWLGRVGLGLLLGLFLLSS
jgi:hypothetical protein